MKIVCSANLHIDAVYTIRRRVNEAILLAFPPMRLVRRWSMRMKQQLQKLPGMLLPERRRMRSRRPSLQRSQPRRVPAPKPDRLLIPLLLLLAALLVVPAGAQTSPSTPATAPAAQAPAAPSLKAVQAASPSTSPASADQAKAADLASQRAEVKRESWWLRFWAYFLVVIGGAHGGLIYGISRNRGVIIPHFQRQQNKGENSTFTKLDLGYLGDILVGIGGGIIIFNLVPQTDPDIFVSLFRNSADFGRIASLMMKVLALSLIGGFAGISLFDEAAKRISQELEEVRSQANATSGLINQLQGEGDLEAQLQYLINPMTDPSIPPLTESQNLEFKTAVLKAPLYLRNKVFDRLQTAHNNNLITGNDPPLSKPEIQTRLTLQKSLLVGFESLIAAAEEQEKNKLPADLNKHRYLAHNGFIHDQIALGNESLGFQGDTSQHWRQGEENLNAAIVLRDQIAGNEETYWYYNLERMLCRFKLGKRSQVTDEINDEKTIRWINRDPGIVYAQAKFMPGDFLEFLRTSSSNKPELKDLVDKLTTPPTTTQPPPTSQGVGSGVAGATPEPTPTPLLTTLQRIRNRGSL